MTKKTENEELGLGLLADMPRSHAESVLKLADAMLRYALWPAIAVVVAGITVGSLVAGIEGSLGALVGGIVAFASSFATLWLMRKTAAMNPMLVWAAMDAVAFRRTKIPTLIIDSDDQ